MNARINQ